MMEDCREGDGRHRCPTRGCRSTRSLRHGSFYTHSKRSLTNSIMVSSHHGGKTHMHTYTYIWNDVSTLWLLSHRLCYNRNACTPPPTYDKTFVSFSFSSPLLAQFFTEWQLAKHNSVISVLKFILNIISFSSIFIFSRAAWNASTD